MDTVRSTLGPRGMDKLIFDGQKVTISNDGATIMKLLDIAHPAAKTLVDISMSQDAEARRLRLEYYKKTAVLSGKGGSRGVAMVLFYGG